MASVSFSMGGASKANRTSPPPPTNGVKRTYATLEDAESDDEDASAGKRQNVTHFDLSAGGAVDVTKAKVVKQPLIIKTLANRDWKEASQRKRQKYGLPMEAQATGRGDGAPKQAPAIFGLDVRRSQPDRTDGAPEGESRVEGETDETVPAKPRTDDERAIDALMGVKQESTLAIPAVSEEQAFERDYKNAPNAPTLEEYAAVPVDEFGAAMLRGMGWKEGQGIGNQRGKKQEKAKMPERRPALLGIGAKADAAVAAELGAWGQGAKGRKRMDITYNPLVLRNSKTGEQLTEEELKAKLEEQKDREANQKYVRDSDRKHDRKEKPSRAPRREDDDYDGRDDRRQHEPRRERERGDDRRDEKTRSRRDRSASYDKPRTRRHRSASYDREREKRRDRADQDRSDRDRRDRKRDDSPKDKSRRQRDYDDYDRGHSRRDRYDDDRDRESRRHRR